jgi:hypothetical protein
MLSRTYGKDRKLPREALRARRVNTGHAISWAGGIFKNPTKIVGIRKGQHR